MDDKKIAELKKFINTLADSRIGPLIDLKKLCQSGIYTLAVQMATEHAIEHKNYMYLNSIFGLIDDTPYEINFITALRPRLNFTLTDTKPRKLKHATLYQVTQAANQPTAKPIAVKNPPPKQAKIYDNKREVSEDLMDSRLMLPGSYGAGKRR
ncbi:hypothetical protein [Janthinobacterium sp. PC23-8]|uniref:hypothetical protein n=1 Tax=Janthinobacterium sp. PC23-8 TaxID=2012679 RepID=UPI000B96896C|nr:hypothetical protein [Janthinobacterium sp. PC23-8]OYO25897.1 hypothetical protein CD932_27875 [Janthinobacterium sp. PC23-8]